MDFGHVAVRRLYYRENQLQPQYGFGHNGKSGIQMVSQKRFNLPHHFREFAHGIGGVSTQRMPCVAYAAAKFSADESNIQIATNWLQFAGVCFVRSVKISSNCFSSDGTRLAKRVIT
jgi:hypothetical protein